MSRPRPPLFGLKILVSAQNEWYTKPIPARCNARAGVDSVISINGSVFLSMPKEADLMNFPNTHLEEFLSKSVDDVEKHIRHWLANPTHPPISEKTTGIVVIDIEHPHPSAIYVYKSAPGRLLDRVIHAFAVRAEATRRVFPNAKLGFFGTLVPDGQGRETTKYTLRKEALLRAGRRGMFDEVDCVVPVVYPRFGPTDGRKPWNSYAEYTRQAILGSRALAKSDGTKLSVIPFTTCWIANSDKTSNHDHDVLLDLPTADPLERTLGVQFDVMLEEAVRTVVVWVGTNTEVIESRKVHNPNRRTVSDHICFRGPPKDPVHQN